MTRKRMYDAIKKELEAQGIEITEDNQASVDIAVCCALDYVLSFGVEVSAVLTMAHLDSEAKVAGIFVNKIKGLMK